MVERYTRAVVIEDESLARDELNRGDARFYRCSSTCRFLEPVASCNGKYKEGLVLGIIYYQTFTFDVFT